MKWTPQTRITSASARCADDVGHAVENLRRLVVVREDHRVALALERVDRVDVGREERPFRRRKYILGAVVDGPGPLGDRRCKGKGLDHWVLGHPRTFGGMTDLF
jgi:hypothetical protein